MAGNDQLLRFKKQQKTELKTHLKILLLHSFGFGFWFVVVFSQDGTDSEVE